jgi:cation-transporting ATPase 13A1
LDVFENFNIDGAHKNTVLFSGAKSLQATQSSMCLFIFWLLSLNSHRTGEIPSPVKTPDGICFGVVMRAASERRRANLFEQ